MATTEDPFYSLTASALDTVSFKLKPRMLRKIKVEVGNVPGRTIITKPYPVDNGKLYVLPTYKIKVSGIDNNGNPKENVWEIYRFGVYNNDGSNTEYESRGLFIAGMDEKQTHVISSFDPTYKVHSAASLETGAWVVIDDFLIHDGPDYPATPTYPAGQIYASIGCLEICGGPNGFDKFNDFIISLSGSIKSKKDALVEIGKKKLITIHYLAATRPLLKEYNGQ